jgi:hypothetical protein
MGLRHLSAGGLMRLRGKPGPGFFLLCHSLLPTIQARSVVEVADFTIKGYDV